MTILNIFDALGGLLFFAFAIIIMIFLISLFGRLTNSSFRFRGGATITPFKTNAQIKKGNDEEDLYKNLAKLLEIINLFIDRPQYNSSPIVNQILNTRDYISSDEKMKIASNIIIRGKSKFVIDSYNSYNTKLLNKEIDYSEYRRGLTEILYSATKSPYFLI